MPVLYVTNASTFYVENWRVTNSLIDLHRRNFDFVLVTELSDYQQQYQRTVRCTWCTFNTARQKATASLSHAFFSSY